MATGNPNNPSNLNPGNTNNLNSESNRPLRARDNDTGDWAFAWWWVFWIFLLIVFFGGGWWWGGWYGPGPWVAVPVPAGQVANNQPGNFNNGNAGQQNAPQSTGGEFLGRTVTVTGKVDQVIDNHAFTLANAEGDGRPLLVVLDKQATPTQNLKNGETVRVNGKVEKFDRNQPGQNTKAGQNQSGTEQFAGRPALRASSVAPAGQEQTTKR